MTKYLAAVIISFFTLACHPQLDTKSDRIVGGPCEDCEALLDYQLLSILLSHSDTLPGFVEHEPKIKIMGKVFQKDGKTPASEVILYIYQVDRNGIYQASDHPFGWEKRHGQYRTWLKTNEKGEYEFYTFRPARYPTGTEPEHIHIYIKEPNTIPYYIDNYIFEDDPTLTQDIIAAEKKRGGSGLIQLQENNGILSGKRNIILGLNIPDYK